MNTNRQQNLAKSVKRYRIIAWIAVLICLLIIGKVVYVGTLKREYWMKVAEQKKVKEKPEPAERGIYPDYIVHLKDGTDWIIETKGGEASGHSKNIDMQMGNKFNAFKTVCREI